MDQSPRLSRVASTLKLRVKDVDVARSERLQAEAPEEKPLSLNQHIGAVVQQTLQPAQTPLQRHEAYKAQWRQNVASAEAARRQAQREARWAQQEERDSKLREWFEGKTDEEVSAYLASESFDKLSDRQQAVIHGVPEEIQQGNEAEVDFAIEEADEDPFEFPEAEADDDESTDLAWDDDETGGEMDIAYR